MKSYYTGGFESEMTRAEAALILSVRYASSAIVTCIVAFGLR
jgi:hypothetical protein